MEIEYIIVQAGGKGTRLEHLTANKPKALVPINNLPMIFHLFRKFPDKRFIVIGDYKKDVLKRYLSTFAEVKHIVVDTEDNTGTCSGVKQALDLIPENKPFMLIWSDLILPDTFVVPIKSSNYIGISQTFPCRWKYEHGIFSEERSVEQGIAGMFIFERKALLKDIPMSGELVRWLKDQQMDFGEIGLKGTREFGVLSEYIAEGTEKCRPFNKITVRENQLTKEAIDSQGLKLAVRERAWYQFVQKKGYERIPEIFQYEPLTMEKIDGKSIYEYDLSDEQKRGVLEKLVDALNELHNIENCDADSFSLREAYFQKTMDRIGLIRDIVPFASQPIIRINGRNCRNVFFHQDALEKRLMKMKCAGFKVIHGDCTFSNLMLRNGKEPVLIDPRGYFGYVEIFGDPLYDWSKLYYSIRGNYDRFNLKEFKLEINDVDVALTIPSNGWEHMEEEFFKLLKDVNRDEIKLIHAVIWLSLTTYAWQDYDSICGAFYNGLYYLEEVL